MVSVLGRFEPYFYALLRIVAGLMFLMHGTQKLFGVPGERPTMELGSLMGVAGIIETIGGVMITLGLFASIAAFVASGEMAVAYFKAHAPQGGLPLLNQGEPAVLYCFLFLYIASRGSGVWSIDALLARSRGPNRP